MNDPYLVVDDYAGWALLAGLGLLGFAVLCWQVSQQRLWPGLQALDLWVGAQRSAAPDGLMPLVLAITHFGDAITLGAVALLMALWLALRGQWLALAWWLLATCGNALLLRWVKLLVARPRPQAPYIAEAGYSFPSGHSMSSLVIYGLLALFLWAWSGQRLRSSSQQSWERPARVLAVVLALLLLAVGLSRAWLGVHYASDVLAGWLLGLGWLALLGLLVQPHWRRRRY
jgi:membrane-associated phospholipid phosphatase